MESSDPHSIEAGSLDRTGDGVLLLYRRDSIIVSGANVNWRAQKICAGLNPPVSIAQVVFICTGDVDAGDATAVPREQRRHVTNTFSSSRKTCTRHRPLVRSGKTVMQGGDRGEGHCATPCGCVVARVLRAISGQKHPPFMKADAPIKLDQIISILTLEIAGGTNHQDGPALSWIKIWRSGQYGDRVWRHDIPSLRGQRFFLRTEGRT